MYSEHPQPPFRSPKFYIGLDALFLLFSVIYIIVDAQNLDIVLKYVKPFPVWILIIQLWSLRQVHKQIYTIIWGLFFGSLGDIFLLFQKSNSAFFALGAGAFLIGHLIYVPSLVNTTRDITENRITMREVLQQQPLFIGIWLVLVTFSFWSISTIVKSLKPSQQYFIYVLAIYGSCLVLLTMAGFFYFFNTSHINSKTVFHSGLCFMFGALTFFASDNLLAHGKFNNAVTDPSVANKWQPIFSCLIMITYYVAQFLIAKGAFLVAVYYTEQAPKQAKAIQIQESV